MKRLLLPKNKFARLGINIAFVPIWWCFARRVINRHIFEKIIEYFYSVGFVQGSVSYNHWAGLFFFIPVGSSIVIVPIVLFTIYIWFPKRPTIKSSKD